LQNANWKSKICAVALVILFVQLTFKEIRRMRMIATLLLCGLLVVPVLADDSKPLTPAEAIKNVNEKVTVEMIVKASKNRLEKRGEIYLDSEQDFRDEKNLAIVITKTAAPRFKEAGIDDPAAHYKGKTIRVQGTVILKDDRPRIEVDEPKQIRIVEKDKK
jgi:DNA/RNA endonuclease YhcR with UshA esterase domain